MAFNKPLFTSYKGKESVLSHIYSCKWTFTATLLFLVLFIFVCTRPDETQDMVTEDGLQILWARDDSPTWPPVMDLKPEVRVEKKRAAERMLDDTTRALPTDPEWRAQYAKELHSQENYDAFIALREKCDWVKRPVTATKYFVYNFFEGDGQFYASAPAAELVWKSGKLRNTTRHDLYWLQCDIAVPGSPDEAWRVVRLGPFRGTGGHDWTEASAFDALGFSKELAENAGLPLWITGQVAWSVLGDGGVLGYPPVYQHHMNLYPVKYKMFPNHNPLLSVGGDSACPGGRRAAGGARCLVFTHTQGYGVPFSEPLAYDAQYRDVRATPAHPMDHFAEFGVRWTRQPKKPATHVGVFHSFVFDLADPRSKFAVAYTPANASGVMFYTAPWQTSGHLLAAGLHVHSPHFDSAMVFSGSLAQLGLDQMPFAKYNERPWVPFLPEAHGLTADDVKMHVLSHAKQNGAELRCHFTAQMEYVEAAPHASGPPHLQGWDTEVPYDRASKARCFGDWSFRKGEVLTVVAFNAPQCARGCADQREFVPDGVAQHNVLHAYIGGSDANLNPLPVGTDYPPWSMWASKDPRRYTKASMTDDAFAPGMCLHSQVQGGVPPRSSTDTLDSHFNWFFGKRGGDGLMDRVHMNLATEPFNPIENSIYKSIPSFVKKLSPYYRRRISDKYRDEHEGITI